MPMTATPVTNADWLSRRRLLVMTMVMTRADIRMPMPVMVRTGTIMDTLAHRHGHRNAVIAAFHASNCGRGCAPHHQENRVEKEYESSD
jgi:hypothetical protein